MVKSSCIQVKLRWILYGFGRLPIPHWHTKLGLDVPKNKDETTSKTAIKTLCQAQRLVEYTTYKRVRPLPLRLASTLVDIQGNIILLDHGVGWSVIDNFESGPLMVRKRPLRHIQSAPRTRWSSSHMGEFSISR
jgi:hypothetical protein